MSRKLETSPNDHKIAWLAALAITIHIAESALPSPIPGLKPGLANVITIAALLHFGLTSAIWVSLLRVFVGSLLIGTFLSPTFMLSLGGAVSSIMVLTIMRLVPGQGFGPIGYCLLSAMAHMAGQFFLAYYFFIHHEGIFYLLPVLMTFSVAFGIITGMILHSIQPRLKPILAETTVK